MDSKEAIGPKCKYPWDTSFHSRQPHPHHNPAEGSLTLLTGRVFLLSLTSEVMHQDTNTHFPTPGSSALSLGHVLHHMILVQFCCPSSSRTCGSFLQCHLQSGKGLELRIKWKGTVPEEFILTAREIRLGRFCSCFHMHPAGSVPFLMLLTYPSEIGLSSQLTQLSF